MLKFWFKLFKTYNILLTGINAWANQIYHSYGLTLQHCAYIQNSMCTTSTHDHHYGCVYIMFSVSSVMDTSSTRTVNHHKACGSCLDVRRIIDVGNIHNSVRRSSTPAKPAECSHTFRQTLLTFTGHGCANQFKAKCARLCGSLRNSRCPNKSYSASTWEHRYRILSGGWIGCHLTSCPVSMDSGRFVHTISLKKTRTILINNWFR